MLNLGRARVNPNTVVIQRREEILQLAPILCELAERCDQCGAMHWLTYFLDDEVARHRKPYLVLLKRPGVDARSITSVADLEAAVLLFEYRIFGVPSGAVATGDAVGFNSVIAPANRRARAASLALQVLIDSGASLVLATFDGGLGTFRDDIFSTTPDLLFAIRQRDVQRFLPLESTLDLTLARLGKKTRCNLRYYRRRLEGELGCEYIAYAAGLLETADLQAINRSSLNPLPEAEFMRRVRSASELSGAFLSGLRGPDGQWLSLMGGWRHGDTSVLHWQMNTAGYEKLSIGTVMRCFLLEDEVGRGTRRLFMYGGTPHSMRHAFTWEPITDLVVRRPGLYASLLVGAARLFASGIGLFGRGNFFANTLQDPAIQWCSSRPAVRVTGFSRN